MQPLLKYPRAVGLQLLDFLYPLHCVLCGVKTPADAGELCEDCSEAFPKNEPPFCPYCGQGQLAQPDPALCPSCRGKPFVFDQAWSALLYEGGVRDCLHHFKYRERVLLVKPLSEILIRFAGASLPCASFDAIAPVPLFPGRERERGYNQSLLLSQRLSVALGLPLLKRSLIRSRETPSQISLSKEKRLKNVRGAFDVRTPSLIQKKRILLIDDILTTGATANACAAALKEAGAVSVCVATLARG